MLSTYNRTFTDANSQCRLAGGSLVTHRSLALQLEVEKYYIDMGLLFPYYHRVSRPPGWLAGGMVVCALPWQHIAVHWEAPP